jgi:hypothetical protein
MAAVIVTNAVLAIQLGAQALQFLQQLQTMMQNAAAENRDITDAEMNTLHSNYIDMKGQVDAYLVSHVAKQNAAATAQGS